MNMARAVLWDMEGTLINSEEYHWISWRDTMANEGIAISREQFLSSFSQRNDSIIPRWLGAAPTPERIERIANAKEELYRHLVRTNAISPLPGVATWVHRLQTRDGLRQSPRRRRLRTSGWSSKLLRLPTLFRLLSGLNHS